MLELEDLKVEDQTNTDGAPGRVHSRLHVAYLQSVTKKEGFLPSFCSFLVNPAILKLQGTCSTSSACFACLQNKAMHRTTAGFESAQASSSVYLTLSSKNSQRPFRNVVKTGCENQKRAAFRGRFRAGFAHFG